MSEVITGETAMDQVVIGTAEEVAKLLLYLAGEDAGYITGQVFGVNGGLVI